MYQTLIPSEVYLGNLNHVMVVLGWFNKNEFRKLVNPNLYGVCGSLFNGEYGAQILISNLLYNPQITDVVLCNITSADAWLKFPCTQFFNKLIQSKHDPDIRNLLEKVQFTFVENECDLIHTLKEMYSAPIRETDREQVARPIKIELPDTKPGLFNGQTIRNRSLSDAHTEILKRIYTTGKDTNPTKMIRELLNLSATVTDLPINEKELFGLADESTQLYMKQFVEGTNDSHNYGYGDRLNTHFGFNQIDSVVAKLKNKKDSLAANLAIWSASDLLTGSSPCLTQVWLRLIDNQLNLTAVFRSNDMFKAWKSNVLGLRMLQIKIADQLNVTSGDLTTFSMSAHIYHLDFLAIKEVISICKTPKPHYFSEVGNFTIKYLNEHFTVTQTDNYGNLIWTYSLSESSKKCAVASALLKQIVKANPSIEMSHVLYLSEELNRCECEKIDYKQR